MNQPKQTQIEELELHLGALAAQWRCQHKAGNLSGAQQIVEEYYLTYDKLLRLDWDEALFPDSELPDELMPKHYIERWGSLKQH
jgi:hypothetical protein